MVQNYISEIYVSISIKYMSPYMYKHREHDSIQGG